MGQDFNWHLTKDDVQMANKHMNRSCTSCVIKKIQIKTMIEHYAPSEWPKSRKRTPPNAEDNINHTNSHLLPMEMQQQPHWKSVWWFLTKLNLLIPYHLAIMPFGIYPMEFKTYVHTKTCTWMFKATLFIFVKTWKQSICPSIGK